MISMTSRVVIGCILLSSRFGYAESTDLGNKWQTVSVREEVSPIFGIEDVKSSSTTSGVERLNPSQDPKLPVQSSDQANPNRQWSIAADDRSGLAGYWTHETAITGGTCYRFEVQRKTNRMSLPRRSAVVRLIWLGKDGSAVLRPDPTFTSYRPGERPRAEPEFPAELETTGAWTTLGGTYLAPQDATKLKIELHFRWGEPQSSVHWKNPTLVSQEAKPSRKVRLATVHYQPRSGKTPQEKREQFVPLIADAKRQNADLVVLPETLTYYGTGKKFDEIAEPVPGPSTEFFGKLAQQHDLYIVAGIVERDQHLIYNVAVLVGPDGQLVGKYRKTTLPRGEIEAGLTPGSDYPVFETRFGKVGMMICYDGFFPEVARELSNRGAEVIAWPVWGCNPLLAAARACENHIYLISSTYTESNRNWILSAVYGHNGSTLVAAKDFGSVVVAEVDLDQPTYWHSLGDFRSQIQPHRPRLESASP
jgi:predicted amidohydrolase